MSSSSGMSRIALVLGILALMGSAGGQAKEDEDAEG